jgi:spore coat protein H
MFRSPIKANRGGNGCAARALLAGVFWLAVMISPFGAASEKASNYREEADSFFTNGTPLQLSIEIPKTSLESLRKDPRRYARATVREGSTVYSNVAVHLKGSAGSFRGVDDRPGMTLNFGLIQPDSPRFHGLKKIHLNNSVQDPTCLSELVCGEMFRQAGVPAARAAHALLELNGRKLGLFVVLESMNKQFLGSYFRRPGGNLYGQAGGCEITDNIERMEGERPSNWEDLHALAAAAQEKDPLQRLERLERSLDLDRFLSFTAMEVLLCHWDGYTFARHNYRVYHDLDTGRMVFFPHDLDQLMQDPNVPIVPGVSGLISQVVLSTPELRSRYRARVRQLRSEVFVVARLTNQVEQALARLEPSLRAYNADLARDLRNHANGLKQRFLERGRSLDRQFAAAVAKAIKFESNVATPGGWRMENEGGAARLEQKPDADGKPALRIEATARTTASWRTRLVLGGGRYRFEGLARTSEIVATKDERGEGAGLRISGSLQPRPNRLTGSSPWQTLTYEFEVSPPGDEVELVCELRATRGQVWFDAKSLRLVKLP